MIFFLFLSDNVFRKVFSDRHCTSLGPAEKERESVMLHLKQEEYTPAPLGPKD